ncbi:hypothetical protein OEZ85_012112 [Tetradesmus obliquus]|uniref:ERCC4 domain-containing protein n=1 Tax=Tetradesmus obliquus TaxID=3088 RepID=A0ABY8TUN9_TETOB|nr:hypothetical protein OEZ85_012112 [Tetradesmus obliquus]
MRMTAEERAAQRAEQKARKEAEKLAAKLRRQEEQQARKEETAAGKAAAKAAKRFETFAARKQNGAFCEYESVLVMDAATARAALGMALSAELDRRKTMCWQVVPQLPLSGRWPGCSCFCFKRRKMCEADEHASKTASTTQLHSFPEDAAPPYVQLVFETPAAFFSELTRDSLAGLLAAAAAAHPNTTLGLLVLGLKSHVQRADNQSMRKGTATQWDWRRVEQQLLAVHLSTPGLQLRLLGKLEEAAGHLINTARVLGQQPYSSENQLEACGGAGPSQASKSAGAAMAGELGPTTCSFAVNTLGKMHGMGGNKAWAVAKAYPSFGALIAGFQRAAAVPGGKPALLLQDLLEPAGSGKAKPRRVGPAMSKRLHLLLTCEDPDTIAEGVDGDAD